MQIPQSTAKLVMFKAYLDTDHTTEATGKTIAITISKNGGAFGNPNAGATNATEVSSGWYKVTLDTTDTGTLGPIAVRGAQADIDDVGVLFEVVAVTLTAAVIADAVWDEDATGHQTGGTFGQAIGDPGADTTTIYQSVVTDAAGTHVAADIIAIKAQTAAIETDTAEIGAAGAGLTNINLPNQTMDIVGSITGNLSGSVGSVTGAVGSVTGAVGSISAGGIVAASFAANAITAAKLDPDVTTELQAGLATSSAVATLQTSVDDLPTNAELATSQAAADDATLAAIAALNDVTATEVADAVWEEILADHSGTVGSTAEALNAAGAAGDPWTTALPGAYGAGSAGKIIGDNINTTISSRATNSGQITIDTVVDAIKLKTDSLNFTVAGVVDSNITHVNDTEVNGDGAGTPWGP
jgi:hypothetical protein